MRKQFESIGKNEDVRRNLISIKEELRNGQGLEELQMLFGREPEVLLRGLNHEDAKIRKNTALVLGSLGTPACRDALWEAYGAETQRFVLSAYPEALKGCDCGDLLDGLRERKRELLAEEETLETAKHRQEELRALNALLAQYEKPKRHRFTGFSRPSDVVLITHRDYREITLRQITEGQCVLLRSGVKVLGGSPASLMKLRTFRELLFCLDAGELLKERAAEGLAASDLLSLLDALHEGEGPFYFRIECKSRMTLEQRSAFTKKLAARLEVLTGGRLVNSVSDYELELRLVETKTGGFYPLVKLYTLPDRRFSYRKNSVAASIRPDQAALFMELAGEYLKENARVLDPFCGVGTMLIERNYRVHADALYGVDIYEPAIAGARENTEAARMTVHYVHRDFRDFTHTYPFDEIVTNFPAKGKGRDGQELEFLYEKFFDRAEELLCPGGLVLLYSHDPVFVRRRLKEHKAMRILKEWPMGGKEESLLFAIRYGTERI